MTKILIEDIEKEPNKTMFYEFDEYMEEFGADIYADLELKSLGQFIKISGSAQGKLKLICDRCLHEFDYDLDIDIEETLKKTVSKGVGLGGIDTRGVARRLY